MALDMSREPVCHFALWIPLNAFQMHVHVLPLAETFMGFCERRGEISSLQKPLSNALPYSLSEIVAGTVMYANRIVVCRDFGGDHDAAGPF